MKKIVSICVLFILMGHLSLAQTTDTRLLDFNQKRGTLQKRGLYVLGSWALGNIAVSGAMWNSTTGSENYFHQFNVYWNSVNVLIGAGGLWKLRKYDPAKYNTFESLNEHYKSEKTFIFNAALDIAYITAGFLLRDKQENSLDAQQRNQGFGDGLILQGSFLFVFDVGMYILHQRHLIKSKSFLNKIQLSSNGMGLRMVF
jgi:hypothetical protein